MSNPHVLLTNDDGIDAPGIASLYEELTAVADVTVVAPDENQSGVGRTRSAHVEVSDHPWGHRVAGTPGDCVAFGLGGGLDEPVDAVVSGTNAGPNVGNYVVGRSGTVGACLEAAFLDTPAIAVSAYHSEDFHPYPPEEYDFDRPGRVASRLFERFFDAEEPVFADVDFLNLNVPIDVTDPTVSLTRPMADYEQVVAADPEDDADAAGGADADRDVEWKRYRLEDKVWPHVAGWDNPFPGIEDHRDRYPVGSDRRALLDGGVSVSPLSVDHEFVDSPAIRSVVEGVDALDLG